jgi:hypothetical protein
MCVCAVVNLTDAHIAMLEAMAGRLACLHVCTCMSRRPDDLRRLAEAGKMPPGLRLDGGATLLAALGLSRASLRAIAHLDLMLYVDGASGVGADTGAVDGDDGCGLLRNVLRSTGMSDGLETLRLRRSRTAPHPGPPAFMGLLDAVRGLRNLVSLELDCPLVDAGGIVPSLCAAVPGCLRTLSAPRLVVRNSGSVVALASLPSLASLCVGGFASALGQPICLVDSKCSKCRWKELRCADAGHNSLPSLLRLPLRGLDRLLLDGILPLHIGPSWSAELVTLLAAKLFSNKGQEVHLALGRDVVAASAFLELLAPLAVAPIARLSVAGICLRRHMYMHMPTLVAAIRRVAPLVPVVEISRV